MAQRTPFRFKTMEKTEADQLNQAFETLFKYKAESIKFTDSAGKNLNKPYQEIEQGITNVSGAGGVSTTTTTISLQTSYSDILNISLEPIGSSFTVNVISYNTNSVTVRIGVTATLGSADYGFFWSVCGSLQ